MANRKMNRLDKYAETRLWNLKMKNRSMTTEALIEEMIIRFKLEDKVSLDQLKKIILAARRRVMRRQAGMKKNIRAWSSKLFLPEDIIAEWTRGGFLTEENIQAISEIFARYRELLKTGMI